MNRSQVLAVARLIRLPNVFTAISNILMGFLFVRGELQPWSMFGFLALSSSALYSAGMVLNDLNDVEVDRQLRPQRPLPSGDLSMALARKLGWGLLLVGVMFAALSCGWHDTTEPVVRWQGLAVASCLAVAIVLYNSALKGTLLGPILMGLCRGKKMHDKREALKRLAESKEFKNWVRVKAAGKEKELQDIDEWVDEQPSWHR